MPKGVQNGYQKADDRNLPKVDAEMLQDFFSSDMFMIPGVKNRKAERATNETYADVALGYCCIKREGEICIARAEMSPEQSVNGKNYHVYCKIDEEKEYIIEARCEDCIASAGGCKHIIAFVAWLHRKSAGESVTSKPCVWKRPKLSAVTQANFEISDLVPERKPEVEPTADLLKHFRNSFIANLQASGSPATIVKYYSDDQKLPPVSMHDLMLGYKKTEAIHNADSFLKEYCPKMMTVDLCRKVEECTREQASGEDTAWFRYRYGRNTASRLWEISNCNTPDGSTSKAILGAVGIPDTEAMKRGRELEPKVVAVLERKLGRRAKKSGLWLDSSLPAFGASPDSIIDEYVVEVKCPSTEKTFNTYFNKDKTQPSNKCNAQIHLQMELAKKPKGIFCVAHPDFATSQAITILYVTKDVAFLNPVLARSTTFWSTNIFPVMYASV
nr:PREDICTED: uncharacterized protein LOC109036727 [Bemisia tabaci]